MPWTAEDLSIAGKASLDFLARGKPIDQISTERPLLSKMLAKKKSFPGGKQFINEKLRKSYDSNFQFYRGAAGVTYNKRDTLADANFAWASAHDGFTLDEDQLAQNGIILTDERSATPSDAEKVQLVNLMTENNEALRLGFDEQFDLALHLDGSQSTDSFVGLDGLISLTPTTGIVGGIDRSVAANSYWRNYAKNSISTATAGTLVDEMEIAWREVTRHTGGPPDLIVCGDSMLDAYRKDAGLTVNRQINNGNNATLDAAVAGTFFHGVPVTWDPVFSVLDSIYAPANSWAKRMYFINTKFLRLRPMEGHDMIVRKPPRVYNRYAHYWGITWKGGVTMTQGNKHAVLRIA